jgi:hypothetical protein
MKKISKKIIGIIVVVVLVFISVFFAFQSEFIQGRFFHNNKTVSDKYNDITKPYKNKPGPGTGDLLGPDSIGPGTGDLL